MGKLVNKFEENQRKNKEDKEAAKVEVKPQKLIQINSVNLFEAMHGKKWFMESPKTESSM